MNGDRSHRILGVFYFDPDDSRLLVPRADKLGWYLNFGQPRSIILLAWIFGSLLLAMVVAPIIAHPHWFFGDPRNVVWWTAAILTAAGMVRLNPHFAWSDYRRTALAAFGLLAATGFLIQAVINGPLLLWWGSKLVWPQHFVLASVAAAGQTFGKWLALSALFRIKPPSSMSDRFRCGLLVGLGFTVYEITFLYFGATWKQIPIDYLALWERASASLFHICSGGLIAIGIGWRRYWPIVLVFGVHTLMDFLAGAGGGFGFSLSGLECVFSACAIVAWVVCIVIKNEI